MKVGKRVDDLSEAPAITLWAPYGQAIVLGLKSFETRGRATKHRGLIFIHSAKRWEEDQEDFWIRSRNTILNMDGVTGEQIFHFAQEPARGAILGFADLVQCWPTTQPGFDLPNMTLFPALTPLERIFGDFSLGRFAYQLENVVRLERPVECDGKQGLWYPPADVVDAVKDEVRRMKGDGSYYAEIRRRALADRRSMVAYIRQGVPSLESDEVAIDHALSSYVEATIDRLQAEADYRLEMAAAQEG